MVHRTGFWRLFRSDACARPSLGFTTVARQPTLQVLEALQQAAGYEPKMSPFSPQAEKDVPGGVTSSLQGLLS